MLISLQVQLVENSLCTFHGLYYPIGIAFLENLLSDSSTRASRNKDISYDSGEEPSFKKNEGMNQN